MIKLEYIFLHCQASGNKLWTVINTLYICICIYFNRLGHCSLHDYFGEQVVYGRFMSLIVVCMCQV